MHELGVAQEILHAVASSLPPEPGIRVRTVRVRVGWFQSLDPDSLRFAFSALSADDPRCRDADLLVEEDAPVIRCESCGGASPPGAWDGRCPACGGARGAFSGGDAIVLQSIEIDAPDDEEERP